MQASKLMRPSQASQKAVSPKPGKVGAKVPKVGVKNSPMTKKVAKVSKITKGKKITAIQRKAAFKGKPIAQETVKGLVKQR